MLLCESPPCQDLHFAAYRCTRFRATYLAAIGRSRRCFFSWPQGATTTQLRRAASLVTFALWMWILRQTRFNGEHCVCRRPKLSTKYIGHDTVDRGLLNLNPWFPLKVVWWHDWWKEHSFSLIKGMSVS